MKKIILIITHSVDLHADIVQEKVLSLGGGCFRLNLDKFPKHYRLCVEADERSDSSFLVHEPSGEMVELNLIGCVWLRKKADFTFLSDDLSIQEKQFANNETEHILKSILFGLNCYWMSHPNALNQAGWKIEQTKRAKKMGFSVPDSLVTNDPSKVQRFRDKHPEGIITKAMSSPYLGSDEVNVEDIEIDMMPTTLITDEMMEGIEGVKEFPTYFQGYVDKAFEVRVTIIGNSVFAARLNSQDSELTKVDSRSMAAEIEYSLYNLPDDIACRCLSFIKSYNLEYGAIDLIVTPKGKYVFLENNPAGQFLYIEQLVPELKMMDCLVNKLMSEALCHA
jgi:glutathione synthase/RimK-type ligase-like ATP-grasp enzyme